MGAMSTLRACPCKASPLRMWGAVDDERRMLTANPQTNGGQMPAVTRVEFRMHGPHDITHEIAP